MPIYTYECGTCGHRFEALGKFEDATKPCPNERIVVAEAPGGAPLYRMCLGYGVRVPSVPAPAQFNCSMPTYQRKKT